MTEPVTTVLAGLGGAIMAFAAAFGSRYTSRQSRAATDAATEVDGRRVNLDEWRELLIGLRHDLTDARERIDRLEMDRGRDRDLLDRMRSHIWERKPPPPPDYRDVPAPRTD